SDERTRAVFTALLDDGVVMPSVSVWHGRAVLRFSVSNWRTGAAEVSETVAAVDRAASAAGAIAVPTGRGEREPPRAPPGGGRPAAGAPPRPGLPGPPPRARFPPAAGAVRRGQRLAGTDGRAH